jgi:anaerobic dimethyl sulfoxide reductase subunit C (anchor subunit)
MNVREWALPVYTILLQLATGSLFLLWIIRALNITQLGDANTDRMIKFPVLIVFLTIIMAIIGAHFHLSKPFHSFLAVSNFRTSWLSREIVFTLSFSLTVGVLAFLQWFVPGRARLKSALGWIAISLGLILIYCMSQIYLLPTQAAWNSPVTIVSFYLTMVLLGSTALPAILLIDYLAFLNVLQQERPVVRLGIVRRTLIWSTTVAVMAWLVVFVLNVYQVNLLRGGDLWAQTSYDLLINLYWPLLALRLGLPLIGIVWLIIPVIRMLRNEKTITDLIFPAYVSCIAVTVGEILGRFLFYATHVRIGV